MLPYTSIENEIKNKNLKILKQVTEIKTNLFLYTFEQNNNPFVKKIMDDFKGRKA